MRPRVIIASAVAVATCVTACGNADGTDTTHSTGKAAGFPVTVTDCKNAKTTISQPPKRIVTSNATGLELLYWLGAGGKVIGTGFPPGPGTMPAQFAQQAAKVPVLGKTVIPKEKLLGSGADLYLDTFGPVSGMPDVASPQEFSAVGINHMYLHSTACAADLAGPQVNLSLVEGDITRLGAVTGTTSRAGELVADMERSVTKVRNAIGVVPDAKRPSVFFFDYDAGTQQPEAVCNRQVANAVITLAGGRNIFSDCSANFEQVSWEDVVAKNPGWIQLGIRNRGSAAANKKAFDDAERFLTTFPATQGLTAVRNRKFLRITSEVTTIAGVRNADTVQQLASMLYPDRFKAGK